MTAVEASSFPSLKTEWTRLASNPIPVSKASETGMLLYFVRVDLWDSSVKSSYQGDVFVMLLEIVHASRL